MEKKKIKIGVLATVSKTMDWFLVDSMRNLSKNGYEVTLISNMEEGFAEKCSDFARCINFKMKRGISFSDLIKCPIKLKRLFKKEGFDVIYYMTPNASMYASLAGKRARIKKRIYNQCGIRYVSLTGIKRRIFKLVEKLTCRFSTHVKAQSPKNMEFAISEGLCKADKISVVGIGGTIGVEIDKCRAIDRAEARKTVRARYNIPEDAFLYGYVGRVNRDKGINELLEAFSKIEKTHERAYLCLVGMYDWQNPITNENYEYAKASRRVTMTGNVPKEEVYTYMSAFDALVHPTYREGFGKVLQEAMGVGIPILTTDVPGPSEVVENGKSGILCRVQDSEDLREKMITLYESPSLCESLAREGTIRAEKYFDRPIMLKNILDDMNKIMESEL